MIRTLLIIAGAALVLCIACVGGAFAIGGRDVFSAMERGESWGWTFDVDDNGNARHFRRIEDSPRVTKTLEWSGGESLTFDSSADVIYVQDAKPSITVSGRQDAVDRVRIIGDRITLDDDDHRGAFGFNVGGDLTITVAGPSVKRFRIDGSGDLDIRGYNQDSLTLVMNGSGDVEAAGRARSLDVDMSGSGEAYLEPLEVTDAKVRVSGSGDADIAATGAVAVEISGSGDVTLGRKPASLATSDSGSGDVYQNN